MDLKSRILDCVDLRTKEVEVPQWKCTLTVQELGLQESMVAFSSVSVDEKGSATLTHTDIAQIVAFGVIDPKTGKRIFADKDVGKLAKKNRSALMILHTAIVGLSSSIEEEVKN